MLLSLNKTDAIRQSFPSPKQIADNSAHTFRQLNAMLDSNSLQESPPREMSEMSKIVLEAGRVATEKRLDYYKRMCIEVTPQMTLVPDKPERAGNAY